MGINFWGVVYGTKAFLPHLRASGDGHIVNISSLFGLLSVPGNGTYNATKFAVRGFTEALREELEVQGAPVSATCIHPGGIKTNIARSAKVDGSMKDLGFHDPAATTRAFEKAFRVTAEDAAETIIRGVERNARRVLIGTDAHLLDALQRLLPSAYQRIIIAGARAHEPANRGAGEGAVVTLSLRTRVRELRDSSLRYAASGRSNAVRWSIRCIAWSASYSALVVGP